MLSNDQLRQQVIERTTEAAKRATSLIDDLTAAIDGVVDSELAAGKPSLQTVLKNFKSQAEAYMAKHAAKPEPAAD